MTLKRHNVVLDTQETEEWDRLRKRRATKAYPADNRSAALRKLIRSNTNSLKRGGMA